LAFEFQGTMLNKSELNFSLEAEVVLGQVIRASRFSVSSQKNTVIWLSDPKKTSIRIRDYNSKFCSSGINWNRGRGRFVLLS